jgi:chaperonin GroES
MSVSIQPMADYVVVKAEEAATKTASGIYLPDSAKEKPKDARVVAVGANIKDLKVGDKVIYKNSYEATDIKQGKEEYTVVYKDNIVATVK